MHKIVEAAPVGNYKIKVRFSDNKEGIVDLSDLAGKGVFSAWKNPSVFNSLYIDKEAHTVAWPGGIDLCPDVLYSKISGLDFSSVLDKKELVSF